VPEHHCQYDPRSKVWHRTQVRRDKRKEEEEEEEEEQQDWYVAMT